MRPKKILFATSNEGKFREAWEILGKSEIELGRLDFAHNEIRSESLEEIALEAVAAAFAQAGEPVFVEDTGLFISALNGFPGTYSAWVQKKLGNTGILRLLEGEKDRSASFRAALAYTDGKQARVFPGICKGSIAEKPAGESGFGYDPIFIPQGHSQTFAQNKELKNELSHRYQSLLEFSKYLKEAKS